MQYYFFHLMPWPHLPADFDAQYDSAWVWVPNSLYDPVKGHQLYQEYINTLAYAEELGFDGLCVNEHHQNAYGLMPSPNIIAGALTQRTRRCKIAVIGNALPLYNPPLRVAYFHIDVFKQVSALFREACDKAGYTARPEQMGWGVPIYVAETDKQAREQFESHCWYFTRFLLKNIGLSPPGYTTAKSAAAI